MSEIEVWRFLHILMFVGWLGADLGVYMASRKAMDSTLQFETRLMLLHTAMRIELIPRTMWKAALPLGVMSASQLGLIDISAAGIAAVWIGTAIWWAVSMTGAYYYYNDFGKRLTTVNNWLVGLVGAALIAVAWTSHLGNGPFNPDASWLLWKIGLYGLIQFTALGIIVGFGPIGPAFMQLGDEGSTPELENYIHKKFNIAAVPIWATYSLVALVAFIGTTKFI